MYKSLKMLKDDGYLGFIVPTSMNNGRYFKELRKYIVDNCSIQHMEIKKNNNLFNDVTQSVMFFRKQMIIIIIMYSRKIIILYSPVIKNS